MTSPSIEPPSESSLVAEFGAGGEEVTHDRLAGEWWIRQLRYGNRYSTDDVLTAWLAHVSGGDATRLLDLGAGVGSIGLMTLLLAPGGAQLTAVEVQPTSAALLRATIVDNGLGERVAIRVGDLRAPGIIPAGARFDLITANPPYFIPGTSLVSPNPQRAAARIEFHGDVFDYCDAAAAHLAAGGCFCFCHRPGDPRAPLAVVRAGLHVHRRIDVVFRSGRPPALALFACAREPAAALQAETLILREAGGQRTEAFVAIRRTMLIEA